MIWKHRLAQQWNQSNMQLWAILWRMSRETSRTIATEEIENNKMKIRDDQNTLWFMLPPTLDSTSLMLIRHDCVWKVGLGDGTRAWNSSKKDWEVKNYQQLFCIPNYNNATVTRENTAGLLHQITRVNGKAEFMLVNAFRTRCSWHWLSMVFRRDSRTLWSTKISIHTPSSPSWDQDWQTSRTAANNARSGEEEQ